MATRYHHGDLRNTLIEASVALVDDQGLAALTMAEVARRAGVSSGAPYKHFKDRNALLQAMADTVRAHLDEILSESQKNSDDPFRSMGVCYVQWAAEHPALYALLSDPAFLDDATLARDTFWSGLANVLQSSEPLDPSHPLIRELMGRAMAQGLANLFASGVLKRFGIENHNAGRLMHAISADDD